MQAQFKGISSRHPSPGPALLFFFITKNDTLTQIIQFHIEEENNIIMVNLKVINCILGLGLNKRMVYEVT